MLNETVTPRCGLNTTKIENTHQKCASSKSGLPSHIKNTKQSSANDNTKQQTQEHNQRNRPGGVCLVVHIETKRHTTAIRLTNTKQCRGRATHKSTHNLSMLHCIALHCMALHCIAFDAYYTYVHDIRYIHYKHYIHPSVHTYIHTYIHTYKHVAGRDYKFILRGFEATPYILHW